MVTRPVFLPTGVRAALKRETEVAFCGRVLCDPRSGSPVLYTENVFVKFADATSAARMQELLAKYELTVKRPVARASGLTDALTI